MIYLMLANYNKSKLCWILIVPQLRGGGVKNHFKEI